MPVMDLMQIGSVKGVNLYMQMYVHLTCIFMHSHLCFVVVGVVGHAGCDGNGEILGWKARCTCGNTCEEPQPGRDPIPPAMFL